MATVKCFEELEEWKAARELVRDVYRCSSAAALSRDFALRDQLRRAAISVMANIAEGFERGSDKEFVQFLAIARGSCGETRALLVIAGDQSYLTDGEAKKIDGACRQVSRMLFGLQSYLNNSHKTGRRLGAARSSKA